MSGAFASNLSGISDDEYFDTRVVEDQLANIRTKVHKASSIDELRELCSSFDKLVVQCVHDINDLKSTEVDLRGRIRRLESAEEEHISRTKLLKNEVAQYKQKWQGALDLVDILDQQLVKYGGPQQAKKGSADLCGGATDVDSDDEGAGHSDAAVQQRLTQALHHNANLQQHVKELEHQLLKANQKTTPPPADTSTTGSTIRSATYDLAALRQELEDCIKQGLSPQLNVHIHHHEDHHIHNHEHQHYYGYKNLTTPRGVPTTVTLDNAPSNVSVSVTAPMVARPAPIKN